MNKRTAQLREDEKVLRKRLELAFEGAAWELINGIEDEDISVPLRRQRIWHWLIFVSPQAAISFWSSTKMVIDVPLLRSKPNMRLTTDGLRVTPPNEHVPYWTRDLPLKNYSNDELREMTENIYSLYEDRT